MAGRVVSQAIRLISNLILTRLIFPEDFGLVALGTTLLIGLAMASDLGVQPSLIHNEREDDAFLNTAWTLQALRGLGIAVVACLLARPYEMIYAQSGLAWLVPILAAGAFLEGLIPTKLTLLSRHLQLKRLVVVDLSARAVAIVAMVGWALVQPSVVALAVGALSFAAARLLFAHLMVPGRRNSLHWEPKAARSLARYGKWIFVSSLLTFLALQLDTLLLGKLIPLKLLGVYGIGLLLIRLFREFTNTLMAKVLFPALAEAWREGPDGLRLAFEGSRRLVLRVAVLITLGMLFGSVAFYELLYDPRYRDAVWIAQLSLATAWADFLLGSASQVLLATGQTAALARINGVRLIVTLCGCSAGFLWLGLPGFVGGAALGGATGYLVCSLALRRHELRLVRLDLPCNLLLLGTGLLGVGAIEGVRVLVSDVAAQILSVAGALTLGVLLLAQLHAALRGGARARPASAE